VAEPRRIEADLLSAKLEGSSHLRCAGKATRPMVTFKFHNQRSTAVELIIEPWGVTERVEPDCDLSFRVNAFPPAEVEFASTEDGNPYVFVLSERVDIHDGSVVKHRFKTKIRPPAGSFRILNKLLFSRRD
jgi:hypothetical protein